MVQGARTERAAAEMVGVLMLISILVVVIGIIAVVLFSTPPPDKNPAVNLRITNESRFIKLYHAGGDSLQNDKIQVYVDGTPRTFNGFGTDDTWSLGETLDYTVPASDPMPNKVDIVYAENPRRGTNAALIATLLLGDQTYLPQDLTVFTIIASAGSGGSISPSGAVSIVSGAPATFTINPDPFYTIFNVIVDGVPVGPVSSYIFPSVTEPHTITVTFAAPSVPSYRINATAGPNGMISPGNVTVLSGTNQSFTITPNPSYRVANVVVNGTYQAGPVSSYTFTNVTSNQTIAATFASTNSNGLIGNYYLGQTWSGPGVTKIAPRIRFADDAETALNGYQSDVVHWPLGYLGRDDNFSVRFDGLIKIEVNDTYTFYLSSDDGSDLTLDGTQVINNLGLHSWTMVQRSVYLTAGYHPISVRMFEATGEAGVYLEYSNTSMGRQFVTELYHNTTAAPTVDFTATPTAGTAPLMVQFTDTSTDATAWTWDFGDGTPVSYDQNPSHIYTSSGQYTVTLTAANSAGTNTTFKTNYITVGSYAPGLSANYYYGQTFINPAGTRVDNQIRFADAAAEAIGEVTDESNWPTSMVGRQDDFSVTWDGYLRVTANNTYTFSLRSDDGSRLWIDEALVVDNWGLHSPTTVTGTVTLSSGFHHIVVMMYENGGQAVARLQYSSPSMPLQQVTDLWHISSAPQPPIAGFSGTPVSGIVPLAVQFTDSSTNTPTSWLWNFGDGDTTNSTLQNPLHRYATAGTYTVSLKAANAGGNNTLTRNNYVTVSPSQPVAGFSGLPLSGGVPLTVIYSDSSTNTPTSWLWNFGDGNTTNNTQQNPVHRYNIAGTYTVSLNATNTAGSNTSTRVNYITVNPQAPVASFTGTPTSGIVPLTVIFTDSSTNAPTSWLWNFGDGDTANNTFMNPVHRYSSTGTYTITLTATNAGGSNISTRTGYITVNLPPPVAGFSGTPTSGNRPLTVTFTDSSTNTPTSWLWIFGDGNTTNNTIKNPVHRYSSAGTYSVTITATNAGGSNSTTRMSYITANLPPRQTIFSDNFETAFSGWTTSGTANWNNANPRNGTYAIQFRDNGQISRIVSTSGYETIIVSFALAANSLEGVESVQAQWSPDGSTWNAMAQIVNGDAFEDNALHYYSIGLPVGADNDASFAIRFRLVGTGNDRGYVDDIAVTGIPL